MTTIAFDTETKGFEWWNGETAFIATTSDGKREEVFNLSMPDESLAFQHRLFSADRLVCHNLSFDVHQVRATIGLDLVEWAESEGVELHDTDLYARCVWPESSWGEHGGFGLKNLAKVFLGVEPESEDAIKEAGKEIGYKTLNKTGAYYDVWRAFPAVMEKYALIDARITWDLFAKLEAEADETAIASYEQERRIAPIIIRAEQVGTALDGPAVKRLHKDYLKKQKALHTSLTTQLGDEALGGLGSEAALIEALQSQGVPLHRQTDSGGLSTSRWALQEFEKDHPVIAEFLEYRVVSKFLSTYIEPMLKSDVVHPSIRQIGAWTSRMSCMRPNMQNIPVRAGSEVRECFVPRPGYKLVAADFDQIEARVFAYYLGPEGQPFRDLINGGHDLHAWMAATLANRGVEPWASAPISPVEGRTVGKHTPEDFDKEGPNSKLRASAKHTLFAILYGAGGCRICDQLGLDTGPPLTPSDWVVQKGYKDLGEPSCAQGQAIAKAIKDAIPGYKRFARRVRDKVEGHGFVTTMLGRYLPLSRDKGYVGIAALCQGTAAGVIKEAIAVADPILANHGGRILMIVHDEILAEVPEAQAEAAAEGLRLAMESAVQCDPPFLASATVADNYGEAK